MTELVEWGRTRDEEGDLWRKCGSSEKNSEKLVMIKESFLVEALMTLVAKQIDDENKESFSVQFKKGTFVYFVYS